MRITNQYLRIRLVLGLVSLIVGLSGANLALFNWVERAGLCYLLGEYARYVCAYGGFGAMIFGAMLVNDSLPLKRPMRKKPARNLETTCGIETEQEEIVFEQETSDN